MPETPLSAPGRPSTSPRPLLRRSRRDRVLLGVCGGLGRYLDVDPVLVRVVAVLLVVAGIGVPAYVVAWLVVPEADDDEPWSPTDALTRHRTVVVLGTGLVVAGLVLTTRGMPWMHLDLIWPALVALAGVGLVVTGSRR